MLKCYQLHAKFIASLIVIFQRVSEVARKIDSSLRIHRNHFAFTCFLANFAEKAHTLLLPWVLFYKDHRRPMRRRLRSRKCEPNAVEILHKPKQEIRLFLSNLSGRESFHSFIEYQLIAYNILFE